MEAPYVCKLCRCTDCQIVFGVECDCGECHGERSKEDNRICVGCIAIRIRVANLSPELLAIRESEFLTEPSLYDE